MSPWGVARLLLFAIAVLGMLLAPPAVTVHAWLLLLAVPLVFWIRGSFDASLSPGDRSIHRALVGLALFVVVMRWLEM